MRHVEIQEPPFIQSGGGIACIAIIGLAGLGAIACAFSGHFVWMAVLVLPALISGLVLREKWIEEGKTPEDHARDRVAQKERDIQRGIRLDAADARATEARAAKYAPPPSNAIVVPGAYFARIRELRWQGIPGNSPTIDLVCGSCAYDWTMPRTIVAQFRTETGPGSGMAAFNNTGATARRNSAMQALTCPACGSIDPGVWLRKK